MVEWSALQFRKLRILLCPGHFTGIGLEGDPCCKIVSHLRQNWRNVEIQKTRKPREEKFILTERIGKGFLEENAIKLDFEN